MVWVERRFRSLCIIVQYARSRTLYPRSPALVSFTHPPRTLGQVWNNTRQFPDDVYGRSHERGDYKRTWEVINDTGLYSYAMHANPTYLVRV